MYLVKFVWEIREDIKKLQGKIDVLEAAIRNLGSDKAPKVTGSRGRKSMGPEERREVSERMRKYWKNRRESKSADQS
jgi:hypothetical protein